MANPLNGALSTRRLFGRLRLDQRPSIDTVYLGVTSTPEPASLACIGTGLGALALFARKLRKNRI
jgi:hypothetical protein